MEENYKDCKRALKEDLKTFLREEKEDGAFSFARPIFSSSKTSISSPKVPEPITPYQEKIKQEPPKMEEKKQILAPIASKPIQKESFSLHPKALTHKDPLSDIKSSFSKLSGEILSKKPIPSDEKAKRIKSSWKEGLMPSDVVIFSTGGEHLSFFQNVARAIETHFFPCKVISPLEIEKKGDLDHFLASEDLKLIILSDTLLFSLKPLISRYSEIQAQNQKFLAKVPLLVISDPSLYLKDPLLKRSLWNLLCQMLSKQKS
jgi:hypothetical protein